MDQKPSKFKMIATVFGIFLIGMSIMVIVFATVPERTLFHPVTTYSLVGLTALVLCYGEGWLERLLQRVPAKAKQ